MRQAGRAAKDQATRRAVLALLHRLAMPGVPGRMAISVSVALAAVGVDHLPRYPAQAAMAVSPAEERAVEAAV
jgi:hypothetical protein